MTDRIDARGELSDWSRDYLQQFLADPGSIPVESFSINVCRIYATIPLSDSERALADEILRRLMSSVEQQVRQAMVEHLRSCEFLPRDVARTLAEDVESVALPMLEVSEALTEEDLIAIVREKEETYQTAIARRQEVSEPVSDALVNTCREAPVETLLSNPGARLWEETMDNIVQLFPDSRPIRKALAQRPDLPAHISEKLTKAVADNLHFEVVSRHARGGDLLENLLQQGGESATLDMLAAYDRIEDAESLVSELHRAGRLTSTLVLRALYFGQLDFFEFAVARIAHIDVVQTRRVLYGKFEQPFKQLYRRAGLPVNLYQSFRGALQRLQTEVQRFDETWDGEARRLVTRLAMRPHFDRRGFEAVLHISSGG